MKLPLRGIVPPMITPLRWADELDVEGLERLIEHILAGGVSGLFLLGTTGEGPSLSYRLRRELIERSCRLVNGRVPVLVCVTDTAEQESVDLARFSAEHSASAVVFSAPFYFPIGQAELWAYIERLARRLPLPALLYNMPSHTKLNFAVETVRAAQQLPNIIGIKDSSADLEYFAQLAAFAHDRPEWSLFIGPEELLAEALALGADGGVCGGANLYPSLYVALCRAAESKDAAQIEMVRQQIARVSRLYRVADEGRAVITALKCALKTRGICDDALASPIAPLTAAQQARVQELLAKLA